MPLGGGKIQDLRETGPGRPVIAGVGIWNSPSFTWNVDITPEVETGPRQLFLKACSDNESPKSSAGDL